jgi:hypothetical protein
VRFLLGFEEPKDTRFAKLSPLGVAGFDGGFDGPEEAERGVDRPEALLRITVGKRELELIGGALRGSLEGLEFQLRPFRSSIVYACQQVVAKCLRG